MESPSVTKAHLYAGFQNRIMFLTMSLSIVPLIILGIMMYSQFSGYSRLTAESQISYMAQSQAESVDLFFRKQTAVLNAMAKSHSFDVMTDENFLSRIFELMNYRSAELIDIGVIDETGKHRAYIGPYDLKDKNYAGQPWFDEVMGKGIFISDVFMGFRNFPHFIIAIRRREGQQTWILRATIDQDKIEEIVRSAQLGKSGDAFLLNRSGVYQTNPRFEGSVLGQAKIDPRSFGGRACVMEVTDDNMKPFLYAGSRLNENKWLLIIRQDPAEMISGMSEVRLFEIIIILSASMLILWISFITTRLTIRQLIKADEKADIFQAELIQTDRLAALGKLAAGVAHEINNPLTVILQQTGWMEDLLEEEALRNSPNLEELNMAVGRIEKHVERARKVVHDMLGYARKMEPRSEDVNINRVLTQTVTFAENYSRTKKIRILTELDDSLPVIAGDQSKLQQVFLNLMTNSIDAIREEGSVEIRSWYDKTHIFVTIRDDGPGFSEEVRKKLFDPFFTTKEQGEGSGLGLWVSYNIIDSMGGSIHAKSRQGEGTVFIVELPVIPPERK